MEKQVPEPYNHQKEGFQFIKNKDYFALFMEQGTGKSKLAIMKAHQLFVDGLINCVVVVAPNAVKDQWIEEQFPLHFPEDSWEGFIWDSIKVDQTQKKKREFWDKFKSGKLLVISINVEAFAHKTIDSYIKLILKEKKSFWVIDESTRIQNGRRKPMRGGKRGGAKRTNKILDISNHLRYKCILTGTPFSKSPFGLWSQYEFLDQNFFKVDYFVFEHKYGIMVKHINQKGQNFKTVLDRKTFNLVKYALKRYREISPDVIGELAFRFNLSTSDIIRINKMEELKSYKNLDELKNKISSVTFFKKKEACLDLPPKIYEKLYAPLGKEQKRLYKELVQDLFALYKEEELTVPNKLVATMRLQAIAGGLFPYKVEQVDTIEILGEEQEKVKVYYENKIIEDGGKITTLIEDLQDVPEATFVIVWARFKGEVDLIYNKLREKDFTCEKYYSNSSPGVISRFKSKEFQILISTSKGAEGLNLQVATLHYFYSNDFRPDLRSQKEDRSHRSGQTQKVVYKDIICRGTVDEKVYKVLMDGIDLIDYFRTAPLLEIIQ